MVSIMVSLFVMHYIRIHLIISSDCIHLVKKKERNFFRLNTVTLTKVKLKSINDVALDDRASNTLRGDTIRLGAVYVFDDIHDEILETVFQDNYYMMMN